MLYETVFPSSSSSPAELGLVLKAGVAPHHMPVVASAALRGLPLSERLPVEGDLLQSVNGVSLPWEPGAHRKALELMRDDTAGRNPTTLGFLSRQRSSAADVSFKQALRAHAGGGRAPPDRA